MSTTTAFKLDPNRGAAAPAVAPNVRTAPFGAKAQQHQQDTGEKKQKDPTYLWINVVLATWVGVSETYPDGVFTTQLPYGLPVDTMSQLPIKGSADYLQNVVHPRNAFQAKLCELGFSMEPGESKYLTDVSISPENPGPVIALQLRRVTDDAPKEASTSDMANMIASLKF